MAEGADVSMRTRLALVGEGGDAFRSAAPTDEGHVFGGLLVAQALHAAARTAPEGRLPHALHASFVAGGKPGEHVTYDVERTRDGGTFSTRRVVATQGGGTVLVLTAALQADEDGVDYEPPAPLGVPGPDACPVGRYDSPWFACRDVPVEAAPTSPAHARWSWFKAAAPIGDDPLWQVLALAYLGDHGPTRAAREPHVHLGDDARRLSVSLDHSAWFHRPGDLDGWLLVELLPAATGRGLALGSIRDEHGVLLATLAQEVLLRERR